MIELKILPYAILLAFAVLLLLPLVESVFAAVRRRSVRCPATGERTAVDFVERAVFGVVAPVDVASCSAVADLANINCGKACLGPRPVSRSD